MIYQIQYRIKGRQPTKRLIDEARTAYANNRSLPEGVTVRPMAWKGNLGRLKAAIRRNTCFVGEAGIVKQYAESRLSLCDYDTQWRPSMDRIQRLSKMLGVGISWIREDRTRRGWHVLILWKKAMTPLALVAIQCVLGSDYERETYNLARIFSGKKSKRWNLLFERKL